MTRKQPEKGLALTAVSPYMVDYMTLHPRQASLAQLVACITAYHMTYTVLSTHGHIYR